MSNDILVSIIVPTYNHEKYIEQCIHGILIQKVDFKYEVLIGEDCSTDSTCIVLSKIENTLPQCFKIYYREKNLGLGIGGNVDDLYRKACGKYIICCEGDDFWIDESKLQKQKDFLEANEEYYAVAHDCIVVDGESNVTDEVYPSCKDDDYSFEQFMTGCMPGQTASVMFRREYIREHSIFASHYQKYTNFPGDRKKAFIFLCNGKVRCFHEKMSAYRHVTQGGSSFSATMRDWENYYFEQFLFYESIFEYAKDKENKKAVQIAAKLYYYALLKYSIGKRKKYSLKISLKKIFHEKDAVEIMIYSIKRFLVTFVYFNLRIPVKHDKYFV